MTTPTNYIATWFYKESKEDASFYPQAGKRGDSALVHSIYMQIQVPFFTTFRHYHPDDKLLFFSNLDQFPDYLERLFKELRIETVTLPYLCIPPKGWYGAWRNQFYLYDILRYMEKRMQADDTLLICDADCLCMRPLGQLFSDTRKYGALFLIGIGGELSNGQRHDGRAPDYDDWSTPTEGGFKGLNGDIIVWNPVLENAFELSSMGIRVDREALERQLSKIGRAHV